MEPFKRSRDPPPKGSDMDQDEDTAFADNYAERDQAKALREQARAGGLRFEAYLTGDQADWLLERIERGMRSEEHTSELQSLMRISYAVFCLKKKKKQNINSSIQSTEQESTVQIIISIVIEHNTRKL